MLPSPEQFGLSGSMGDRPSLEELLRTVPELATEYYSKDEIIEALADVELAEAAVQAMREKQEGGPDAA